MIGPFLANILAEEYGYDVAYVICGCICISFVSTWAFVCGTSPNFAGDKKFDPENLKLEPDEPETLEKTGSESEISDYRGKFEKKSMMTGYYSLLSKAGT